MGRRRLDKAFGGFDVEIPRRTRTCTAHRCHQRSETTTQHFLMTHVSILRQSATAAMTAYVIIVFAYPFFFFF